MAVLPLAAVFSRVPRVVSGRKTSTSVEKVPQTPRKTYVNPVSKEIPIPDVFVKPHETDPSYLEDMQVIKDAIQKYGYIPEEAEPAIQFMEDAFKSP